ncbi:hypothetical protein CSA80_04385 [Candidatus Saccharibacteria bacterium]|nr:MAG: hypothetical protein CR973_01540 [Candidatus Saccharibacteria bacterium]PID98907.1 MAG: hypothetical protein CSA80_04385 [Candidatus Saccharibacteria bacterium]
MKSLSAQAKDIERQIKRIVRDADIEKLSLQERKLVEKLKMACNEVWLDVRDYEYAETREEQIKWRKLGRHNIAAAEQYLLELGTIFGPVDSAELSANLSAISEQLN